MNSVSLVDILGSYKGLSDYYSSISNLGGTEKIYWDNVLSAWVVTGYQECTALVNSHCLDKSRLDIEDSILKDKDLVSFTRHILKSQMIFSQNEASKKQRQYWFAQLNNAPIDEEESMMVQIANKTLSETPLNKKINIYNDILRKYVSRIISYKLGIDENTRLNLIPQIEYYVRFLDGKLKSEQSLNRAFFSIVSLYSHLGNKIEDFPGGDLDRHEWISNYILVLIAGHESVAYMLATLLLNNTYDFLVNVMLESNSDIFRKLLIESHRYDSPIQLIGRRAVSNFLFKSRKIKKGDKFLLHIGMANRDLGVFKRPDVFQYDRNEALPLSFGIGSTKCIGQTLALRESKAFLKALMSSRIRLNIFHDEVRADHGVAGRNYENIPAILTTNTMNTMNTMNTKKGKVEY